MKSPFENYLANDYVVCACMDVMRSELVRAIEGGVTTFEELQDQFGVGTGCSSCVDEVKQLVREMREK